MKRTVFITIILAVAASAIMSCNSFNGKRNAAETELDDSTKLALEMERLRKEEPEFEIVTTHGTMKVKLYSQTPQHRDNFVKLVSEKYYDGLRFHRVIENFMIQTGDPYSRDIDQINKWGMGGPGYTVPAEFVDEYTHKKGALAAARKGDIANPRKASSGSQFYIVHSEKACAPLNGDYTVFGEVIEGLEVIDAIATTATDRYERPYDDVIITAIKPVVELESETPKAEAEVETIAPADSTKAE